MTVAKSVATPGTSGNKVRLFGMLLDPLTLDEAARRVLALGQSKPATLPCPFVVTPNLDHALRLRDDSEFRSAYGDASLVVADGMPLVFVSRWVGRRSLPERVAGSDLVPALFDAADRTVGSEPLRVFLLGAAPGVAERAARRIEMRWSRIRVVGTHSPPYGFERDASENRKILELIDAAGVDVLLVGLGAPKQELWIHTHRRDVRAGVALCVGAAIDFLAGERARAPRWMQRTGLEWAHRLGTEPRRLATRYVRNAMALPGLIASEWHGRE